MDEDTSIKVSKDTRARLARLAAERNTTLRGLVEDLASATPTAEELAERQESARRVLAQHFGVTVGERELSASARLRQLITDRQTAA